MKQYVSFIGKEFLHIIRDRRSMFILLAVPVVLLLLFGYAVSTEVKNVRVAVLDSSHDVLTRKACDRLAANPYMSLCYSVTGIDDVYSLFRQGKVDVAVIFGNGFFLYGSVLAFPINLQVGKVFDRYGVIGKSTFVFGKHSFQACDICFIRNNTFQTQPFAAKVNFRPSMYDKRRGELCHYFRHNAALKTFDDLCAMQSARNTDRTEQRHEQCGFRIALTVSVRQHLCGGQIVKLVIAEYDFVLHKTIDFSDFVVLIQIIPFAATHKRNDFPCAVIEHFCFL